MALFTMADWVILAVIFMSALISLVRGFVKEALSLTSWAVAFFVAIAFHDQMMSMLAGLIDKVYMREIVAYVVLFGSALVGGTLLTNFISLVVKRTGLSGTDRMLGMVFGAARGLVIILALVILMPSMLTDIEQDQWWKNSQLIPHFQLMTEWSEKTFSEIVEWVSSFVGSHRDSGGAAASNANSTGGFQADGLSFSQAQDSPAAEVNSQSPVHGSPQVQRQGN